MNCSSRFHTKLSRCHWPVLLIAAALLLPGQSIVFGQNAKPSSPPAEKSAAERVPTLAEIAKANDTAWNAIKSIDVEYTIVSQCVENGKLTRDTQSKRRWSKSENMERVREYPTTVKINKSRFGNVSKPEFEDYYFDGKLMRHLRDSKPQQEKKDLTYSDQKGLEATIGTKTNWPLCADVELLRYLYFDSSPLKMHQLTLANIISEWTVSIQDKQTTSSGDTLWILHAEYPQKDAKDKRAGTYIDVYVNANKGFLVQKAIFFANGSAHRPDGTPVTSCVVKEIKEFQDCGHGVFFPKTAEFHLLGDAKNIGCKDGYFVMATATKLSVNSPLPDNTFDFHFPENAVVHQDLPGENRKVFVWGPDNKPKKEFSRQEFRKVAENDELERQRERVEKNLASKKPMDVAERGSYYMQTKKYDAAIAEFSEVITAAPKTGEAASAFLLRGMIYLLYLPNFDQASDDFTKAMRLLETIDKDSPSSTSDIGVFRAIAYAMQDSTLDKALADLAKIKATGDDEYAIWGGLIRAAILIHQGKSKTVNDVKQIAKNIHCVPECPDGISLTTLLAAFVEKDDPKYAAQLRETAKKAKAKSSEMPDDSFEADLAAAVHKCLVRLVPEIEKEQSADD